MDDQGLKQRAGQAVDQSKQQLSSQTASKGDAHPLGPVKYSQSVQYLRAVALLLFFFTTAICEFVTQLAGAWLYFYNTEWYYTWMAVTKQHFTLLLLTVTQWWSPTPIRVTGTSDIQNQLQQNPDGTIDARFPERMILISNHQIYTEWIYLWWVAYAARMHGHFYIIMKESLKYIPLLGQGMMFFSFVFLSRHWETDRPRFAHRLKKLKTRYDRPASPGDASSTGTAVKSYLMPMWLLIFPEGTNLSQNQRNKSEAWAEKTSQIPMRHCLIPRSTGLKFCIDELGDTVDWIYDVTIAYEGIRPDQYAQDIFTVRSVFLQGQPPKAVDMYFRRFAIKDVPHSDAKAFEKWVHDRWAEKDDLLAYYYANGKFPSDRGDGAAEVHRSQARTTGVAASDAGARRSGGAERAVVVGGDVRPRSPLELLQVYVPVATIVLLTTQIRSFASRFSG